MRRARWDDWRHRNAEEDPDDCANLVLPAERLTSEERYHGARVIRTWRLPAPNRKARERMANYSSFALSAGLRGLFTRKPDVIIATSPQMLVGMTGWWLAKAKRTPFVFEVRDLWPESLAASGLGRDGSILVRASTDWRASSTEPRTTW